MSKVKMTFTILKSGTTCIPCYIISLRISWPRLLSASSFSPSDLAAKTVRPLLNMVPLAVETMLKAPSPEVEEERLS